MRSGCPLTSEPVIELRPGDEREGVGVGLMDIQLVSIPEWLRYDSLLLRPGIYRIQCGIRPTVS